ncbi:MAG TPA: sigma-54 dependent transcriptional regulator [Gemmatimonadota bacterium]|jgi:NtrC-family two-component system response regulator AlgB
MLDDDAPGFDPETRHLLDSLTQGHADPSALPPTAQQRHLGLRLSAQGRLAEAEVVLRGAHRSAARAADARLMAATTLDLARIALYRSPRECLDLLRALEKMERAEVSWACVHNLLGTVLMELCRFEAAERHFGYALQASRPRPDDPFGVYAMANRARHLFEVGFPGEAMRMNRSALGRLEDRGEATSAGLVLCNMGIHATLQARYDEALDLFERCRAIAPPSSCLRLDAVLELGRAEAELATGEINSALERLDCAARIAIQVPLAAVQARALVWKALVAQRGEEGVLRDVEAAAADLHGRELRYDAGMVYLLAAECARRWGLPEARYDSLARSIFGEEQGARLLTAHYARVVAVLDRPLRGRGGDAFPEFLTRCPVIRSAKSRLQRLTGSDVRILIEGESGTGKTFLARQLHADARRRDAPFIVVDCTNLQENLFESKLFGHVRGAFTGAVGDAVGLVEQAHGGTLFLDEIGEMPVEIQAKLLYTIEEQRYRPVGGRSEKRANFRVIAATNRDIDRMLVEGSLRSDLFYRLAGFRVRLPPLRERREDVMPLAELRLADLNARFARRRTLRLEAWEALARHDWPGNVRELNAVLDRGFHLATGRRIGVEELGLAGEGGPASGVDLSWHAVRRDHVLRVLGLCRGNVTRAARILGLNRTTLIYKLRLLGIERADFDPRFRTREVLQVADGEGTAPSPPDPH